MSIILSISIPLSAASDEPVLASMDSVEVALLTCQPHEEIYSLYGHTALRINDLRTGQDWAFNYGVFNYKAPHFVLRFVFGLTDYELGVLPTKIQESGDGAGAQPDQRGENGHLAGTLCKLPA